VKEALYQTIESRFSFPLPADYRQLEERGLFTLSKASHASEFTAPGSYLWLPDMEWYPLEEIAAFTFQAYHLPGFVPFAFTAGGDYWCWQPAHTDARGTRVVCCHRDCELATVYAPNLAAALYRQALAVCHDTELDAPSFLRRWSADLSGVFSADWCGRLHELAQRADRSTAASASERADIAYAEIDSEVRWMQPS
jgi:hypothetical protein